MKYKDLLKKIKRLEKFTEESAFPGEIRIKGSKAVIKLKCHEITKIIRAFSTLKIPYLIPK